jgi:hypothetical protein
MKPRSMTAGLAVSAVMAGLLIAWVDSRPTWDDTGITAGVVFLAAAFFAALSARRPWFWALAVGAWIPLFGIAIGHNAGALLALAPALVGAYAGALARRAMSPPGAK